jgi:crotonobetainyl-CoA:carnitine CoA-transferase CaiB-like acyl-CoA transferase
VTDRPPRDPRRSGPLSGIRVLDLTHIIVGPYCTKLLGDMGAEIIKVESPDGDSARNFGVARHVGMGANFMIFNRNKRSVVLDLKTEDGYDAFCRLAATCDVFVANFRMAALTKLRIGYADLAAVNPDLIYCRIIGFGENHPDASKPAIDDVIQSLSGIVALQEQLSGTPGYAPLPLSDLVCGLFGLAGILAALYRRAVSGEGEEVEVRMYDAMANFALSPHLGGWTFEPAMAPPFYPRSVSRYKHPYATADGAICIAPYSDRDWRRIFDLLNLTHLGDDPRFDSAHTRNQHLDELYEIVEPQLRARTSGEWLELFEAADIPASEIRSTDHLVRDPSLYENGVLTLDDHPSEGRIRLLGSPIRFSANPPRNDDLPPTLGADTADVLAEIGYGRDELERLSATGAIGGRAPAQPRP